MTSKALQHLSKNDPELSKIIASIPKPEFKNTNNVFVDLVSCIVDQQIHYRGRQTQFKKLKVNLEGLPVTPENIQFRSDNLLTQLKLSKNKFDTLFRVSSFWIENKLHDINWKTLSNSEIKQQLQAIKGIGNWTTDMILLYTLERPDVFPFEDYHLKKVMQKVYQIEDALPLKLEMIDIASYWKPHTSIAVLYLLDWKSKL